MSETISPKRGRHLMECVRQWARWRFQRDDIDRATDDQILEVLEGLKAFGLLPYKALDTPLQDRAEWVRERSASRSLMPMDNG